MRMGLKTGAEAMEKGRPAEVPAEVDTETLKVPRAAVGEIVKVAVIWEAVTRMTLETEMSGLVVVTEAPATKEEPLMVTEKEEAGRPEEGLMEDRTGGARFTVKGTVEEEPPEV